MKPCGIIATYMSRQDWQGKKFLLKVRAIFFNLCLFVGQLTFMIVGTAIGKIKPMRKVDTIEKVMMGIMLVCCSAGIMSMIGIAKTYSKIIYLASPFWAFCILFAVASIRGIDWRRVWRAAQCSHVRLCLKKITLLGVYEQWLFINFGYPKAEIQPWRIDQCDGKRFEYRDPTFDPSPRFIEAMIEYAEDQVGKRYDDWQLASPVTNFPLWIVYPPWWGQEKIKAFNRPGGLEYCSSGFTACLRWGEGRVDERGIRQSIRSLHDTAYSLVGRESEEMTDEYIEIMKRTFTKFFKGYSTAMVSPCLIAIDENWEVT